MLTELMASFLEQDSIKQLYKGRLVGAVLNGYLSLRRLVVQRTRLIDETQEKLLELLEEMTTGWYIGCDTTQMFIFVLLPTNRYFFKKRVLTSLGKRPNSDLYGHSGNQSRNNMYYKSKMLIDTEILRQMGCPT